MFPYRYAVEKLSNALTILAVGEGDVRSRLSSAFLEFHTLQPRDFPAALQADYEWIVQELTRRKPQDELERREWARDGSVTANLRRMKNRTGSRIARRIIDLEHRVQLADEEWYESVRKRAS